MAHAKGSIGTTNYLVEITAGHHALKADENVGLGGQNVAPGPYELLCSALCACTAITLRMYAERKQWPLHSVHVNVHLKPEGDDAGIERVLKFEGGLNAEQRTRLADIAERTPVTRTLKQGLRITTAVES